MFQRNPMPAVRGELKLNVEIQHNELQIENIDFVTLTPLIESMALKTHRTKRSTIAFLFQNVCNYAMSFCANIIKLTLLEPRKDENRLFDIC